MGVRRPVLGGAIDRSDHLVKRYGETVAVADVSFVVSPGEILGYLATRAVVPATGVLLVALALGADNRNGLPGALGVIAIAVALSIAWNGIFYLSASPPGTTPRCSGSNPCSSP